MCFVTFWERAKGDFKQGGILFFHGFLAYEAQCLFVWVWCIFGTPPPRVQ